MVQTKNIIDKQIYILNDNKKSKQLTSLKFDYQVTLR